MAVELTDVVNTGPVDADFPVGKIIDNDGSNNGTPVIEDVYGDIVQFFAKIMRKNGIAYNGIHDSEYDDNFQLLEALIAEVRATKATEDLAGTLEIATLAEFLAGVATDKIITPDKFGVWSKYDIVATNLKTSENGFLDLTAVFGSIRFKLMGKSFIYNIQLGGTLPIGTSGFTFDFNSLMPAGIDLKSGFVQFNSLTLNRDTGAQVEPGEAQFDGSTGVVLFTRIGVADFPLDAVLSCSLSGALELD